VNRRLTLMDRLRIERVLWTVDLLTYDIRTGGRRTIRRDLRTNLRAAAGEAGVGEAIRQLGSLRQLARGYVDAQYGDGARRPRWMGGLWWAFVCAILLVAITCIGAAAFRAGVQAANPGATGTYVWNQVSGVGLSTVTISLAHGQPVRAEITLPFGSMLYVAAAVILGGRLWRLVPRRRA